MAIEHQMPQMTELEATDFFRMVEYTGGDPAYRSALISRAVLLQTLMALPDGTMLNGKISPSVASNNLTLALKTYAGTDPSAANPVLVKINGTWRAGIEALSFTIAAGANTFNAGSAELATNPIDYFAHAVWNTTPATDILDLGASRIPYGMLYSDFSGTATNEKYLAHANASAPAAGDDLVVIGRFEATLSAGAGYTWTVPTFTTANLIQRPIYNTRLLTWTPTQTGFGTPPTGPIFRYFLDGAGNCYLPSIRNSANGTSNATGLTISLPFSMGAVAIAAGLNVSGIAVAIDNTATLATFAECVLSSAAPTVLTCSKDPTGTGWTASGGKRIARCSLIVYPLI